MPLTPPSSRSYRRLLWPLASLLPLACRPTTSPPTYPTADRWEDARRQPDAVALDPLPATTRPASQGAAPSPTPVALQPPLAAGSAFEALQRLVSALTQEDLAALPPLFTERGTWVNPVNHNSMPLFPHFRDRLRRLDYHQLADQVVLREAEAEVYVFDDLTNPLPGRPARPAEMGPSDLLLRVRVLVPRIGADRLFGDSLTLVMRPDNGRYRIHSLHEEFQLP